MTNPYAKTVPEAIADLREDLKDFVTTRVTMFRFEMGEKLRMIRMAAPVMLIGFVLLVISALLFTGFLVCIIAQVFMPSAWAYSFSFILVGVFYAIVGGAAAYLGWRQLRATGLKPEHTIHVLEEDRIWLQTEAKSKL
jgi:VIT1/CCC1 family predicted Fe2+/Mn2+ transporter